MCLKKRKMLTMYDHYKVPVNIWKFDKNLSKRNTLHKSRRKSWYGENIFVKFLIVFIKNVKKMLKSKKKFLSVIENICQNLYVKFYMSNFLCQKYVNILSIVKYLKNSDKPSNKDDNYWNIKFSKNSIWK